MTKGTRVPLHEAEYIAWEKVGTKASGIFLGIVDADQGPGKFIKLQTENGVVRCSAPTTLQRALETTRVGTQIEITYIKQDAPKDKTKAGLKRFEVYADVPADQS